MVKKIDKRRLLYICAGEKLNIDYKVTTKANGVQYTRMGKFILLI